MKRHGEGTRAGLRIKACVFAWVWISCYATLVAAQVNQPSATAVFDIPAMPADLALTEFAEQADLTLVFRVNEVRDKQANALRGRFSLAEGIRLLLAGTGLSATFGSELVLKVVDSTSVEAEGGSVGESNRRTGAWAGIAAVLFGTPVGAQNSANADAIELEEIVVTAQRRAENLQEVPLAITALDRERLQRAGITSPERLEFVAPNVVFAQSGADNRISIRGVSSTGIEVNADPVVGIFSDGIYQSRSSQALAGFVDMERVEVLRGPQGTLYGRNTTAGSINLISRAPEDEFGYSVEGVIGDFDHTGVRGHVNVPVNDAVALRFAGLRETRDGWAKNLFRENDTNNDEDQVYVRGTARVDVSDRLRLVFRASYWDQGGQGSGFNAYKILGQQESFDGPSNPGNPFAGFSTGLADPDGNPADPYEFSNDIKARRDIEQAQASLTLSYEFDGVTFTSISAHNNFNRFTRQDSDFSELDIFDVDVLQDVQTFTQEIQVSSNESGAVGWVVGAFYLDDNVDELFVVRNLSQGFLTPILGPFLINRSGRATTSSLAVFGQTSFNIGDRTRLTLGGRWTSDDKDISVRNLGTEIDNSDDFSETTWRVAIDHDLSERTLLYGYVATGFKSGGFNLNVDSAFEPETVTTAELGLKVTLPARGFINLAGFYSDFDDLQVNSFDPETISSFLRNAAKAEVMGIEVEGELRPGRSWILSGSLSYQDATYEDFVVDDPFAAGVNLVDLSGRNLPRAPDVSAKLAVSRDIDLGAAGTLRPLVQFSYFGENYQTEFNQPLDRQSSYTKTDLRLFWESDDSKFSAQFFITNLEDEAVLISGVYGPGSGLFANYSAPRTYGVRFGVNYY